MRKHTGTIALLLSLSSLASPAWGNVPDDKSGRLEDYQSRRVIYLEKADGYSLTRSEHPLGDEELARLSGDEEAIASLRTKLMLRRGTQLAVGFVGFPCGLLLAYDNFFGKREKQDYAPASTHAPYPPGSFGSYALTLAGGVLAAWGGFLLCQWGLESLGLSNPNLLPSKEAKRLTGNYEQKLREELALSPEDVAGLATASPVP